MSGMLFIISGASGSGKTTLLTQIVANKVVNIAPKYSERPVRKLPDGKTDDPDDDIINVCSIAESQCDIKYVINGRYYGVNTLEIDKILHEKGDCAVVLSDLRVVKELKKKMADKAISIYISSNISPDKLNEIHHGRHPFTPSNIQISTLELQFSRLMSALRLKSWVGVVSCMRELLDGWQEYLPESKSVKIRAEKIRLFHNRYIDNIKLFDHVVLNYYKVEQVFQQFINLKVRDKTAIKFTYPPVFFLAAASGAGKATLMSHINLIGSNKLRVVTKYALRDPKKTDKVDGMKALGKNGKMPEDVDWTWVFHKGDIFEGNTYGIKTAEVLENIGRKIPQIMVSNIGQINNALDKFGDHLVPVYLHSTRSSSEMKDYQYEACGVDKAENEEIRKAKMKEAEARIAGVIEVHNNYINDISKIAHVILNTTYPEDMYDQIFSLLEAYSN